VARLGKVFGKICLDTSIIINYIRGKDGYKDLIEKIYIRFDEVSITVINIYELLVGVEYRNGKDRDQVEYFIENSSVLPFDELASREAALISAELRKLGQEIDAKDILIAAICKTNDICLITNNTKHFGRIRDLAVIDSSDI
jgi:tRNA(fMet)-specific endonuclease VapC